MSIKITHLTSVHPRYDTRIFIKMCSSLAKNKDYHVSLIVADGKGDETKNGVKILDVGSNTGGRLFRMTKTVKKVFEKAKDLNSDMYHIHDPELIPIGLKLKKIGFNVIYDAHEDLPKQLLSKPYLNKPAKIILSNALEKYQKLICNKFNYIITATPYIRDKFLKINKNTVDINNFPIIGELFNDIPWSEKKDEVCYVGSLSSIRGIKEIVKAMEYLENIKLNLVGTFNEKLIEEEVKSYNGWQSVNELGFMHRTGVSNVMKFSKVGIVTFYPLPNHIDSQPNKMFEYMSAGLPVIASNFPLWKEIIEGNNCGICVNPLDPREIAEAISYIITHPVEAQKMGQNGKNAVLEQYNWGIEEKKLFDVYNKILN